MILATTNKIGDIDKSLRRGGRLDIDIGFEMPSPHDRYEVLKVHLDQIMSTGIINIYLI